ncbi:MAG: hypothetical protein V2J07_03235 [Anaerolineae bacterium]|jgi:chromosome segregation ATPase|nr:hypothetical protein [Anaerolineae bacterium]
MDFEQIQKKLDWLDTERRRDKETIASLEISVKTYQEEVGKLSKRINELEGELARSLPVNDQFSVLEEKINGVQIELSRAMDQAVASVNNTKEAEQSELAKRFLVLEQEIEDLRGELEIIPSLEEQIESRKDEEYKLRRMIAEVDEKVEKAQRDDESWLRTITLLEEGRRKDAVRLVDLQSESDQLRKRIEEQVGKGEVVAENVRKIDKRIAEIRQAETQRSQEQRTFFEQQSLKSLELERDWKKVQTNFESFMTKFEAYERKMAEITLMTQRLEESRGTFDDNSERIEKRIHEITEMQRLNREQFLSDWEAFQGEEKHRWSQFMVEEEDRRKDQDRKTVTISEKVDDLKQDTQGLSDDFQSLQQQLTNFWRQLAELIREYLPKNP